MSAFVDVFYLPAETLFEFLALNSIYSAFLAIIFIVTKLIFPKIPRTIEYSLWCLVLIRLILPTDFSIAYSLGYLGNLWFDTQLPIVIKENVWLSYWATQPLFENSDSSITWLKLLLVSWIVISSLVAIKFIRLKIKLSKLLNKAHPVEEEWLVRIVHRWRREFGITRQIIVIDSNDFLSPFTFGVFMPVIFIPEQLMKDKNISVLEPIIAHELAHVKRLDALWLVFQNLLQIIYCLNPILWFVVGKLNSVREEICDRKVLDSRKLSNETYGKSLLKVLRLNIGMKTPEQFATFFLSHKQIFKTRIAAIGANHSFTTNQPTQIVFVGLFAFFFLPLGWRQVVELKELKEFIPPPASYSSPFPEEVRKQYQAPFLLKKTSKKPEDDKTKKVEID